MLIKAVLALLLKLYIKSFNLIAGIRKNMKNYLIDLADKKLLRKRFCIETIFGFLKNSMNLEHTRHRSPINFLINIITVLTAYFLSKDKPTKLFAPLFLFIVEVCYFKCHKLTFIINDYIKLETKEETHTRFGFFNKAYKNLILLFPFDMPCLNKVDSIK